jgi:hypothetical protein
MDFDATPNQKTRQPKSVATRLMGQNLYFRITIDRNSFNNLRHALRPSEALYGAEVYLQ